VNQLSQENKVYLMDKQHNLYAYSLLVSVLAYQTAIVRRDFDEGSCFTSLRCSPYQPKLLG
jgi:hypothetical protein